MANGSNNYENRCRNCGRFIKLDKTVKVKFTPDTEFTYEKTEFLHENCWNKEQP